MTGTVGMPTLSDIMVELSRPGRDPRERFESFRFAEGVEKIEDVRSGMRLPGIVTNITAFGVFVDIGVHQDGLIDISELSDKYVKNPTDVVKVHQKVLVTVLEVDLQRKRISLSMKSRQVSSEGSLERSGKKEGKNETPAESRERKPKRFVNTPFSEASGKSNLKIMANESTTNRHAPTDGASKCLSSGFPGQAVE